MHAISLDGSIASTGFEDDETRASFNLTSHEDQSRVEGLLKHADVVVTGANSLASAGRFWEVINNKGQYVSYAVFSNKGLSASLPFWSQSNIEKVFVSKVPLDLPSNNVENWNYGREHPAVYLVKKLQERGDQRVVLFGGAQINGMFFDKNLVSHLEYTICPVIVAGEKKVNLIAPLFEGVKQAKLIHSKIVKDQVFLSYQMEYVNPLLSSKIKSRTKQN